MIANESRFKQIVARFAKEGIPTVKAGFFDHSAFVAIEKQNPAFLDEYARFVHWQSYDAGYLSRAERIIEIVANGMHRGVLMEKRLGACIDVSMTMGRILDLYGV